MSVDQIATRSFIDTNVLIYAEACDEPVKQRAALALLKQLFEGAWGVLSTQVLQEYCNVALKKLQLPASHIRAQLDFYEQFEVIQVTPAIIHAGLDLHQTRSVGFYDAIIVASAQVAGCSVLLSEDLNAGQTMASVRIVNPFAGL
ncbi:MAG: PIN domain-containing protein [Rhodoferax sp.]|nr:PIN domain-containing protein [Rhodoferax sp.]